MPALSVQTMPDLFVLVHSPLVGPLTWSRVAPVLRERGNDAVVCVVKDAPESHNSYWSQHVASAAAALRTVPVEQAVVLVGHSGAGALLPALGQAIPHRVAAYLFVDAGLPLDGRSHLADMDDAVPEIAQPLRAYLAAGGRFPTWREEDLCEALPDASLRSQLVAELQPRDLAFFNEPIPGFAPGSHASCAYLQFSAAYEGAAVRARQRRWPVHHMPSGHFHMLVASQEVTTALLDLTRAARLAEAPTE